jgi:hypothetical protein
MFLELCALLWQQYSFEIIGDKFLDFLKDKPLSDCGTAPLIGEKGGTT